MDSEHRHELAENDLARLLQTWKEDYGQHLGIIAAAAIAVVVVFIGISVVRGQSSSANQEAWKQLSAASIPENYASVAEDYPGTEVAAWAKYNEGRMYLQEGIREAFTDHETSVARLASAKAAFDAAVESPVAPDEVRERSLLGLATHAEAVSDGDTAAAIAAYRRLLSEYPESSNKKYAEARIATLESESAQEFYAWFSEQKPERKPPAGPLDGMNFPPPPAEESDTEENDTEESNTTDAPADTTAGGATAEGDATEEATTDEAGAETRAVDGKMSNDELKLSAPALPDAAAEEATAEETPSDEGEPADETPAAE